MRKCRNWQTSKTKDLVMVTSCGFKSHLPHWVKVWETLILLGFPIFYFIGNSDVGKHKKKHMFTEHMLDKRVFGHDDRTKEMLEDIKTFDTRFVSK